MTSTPVQQTTTPSTEQPSGTFGSYITGFILSLVFTGATYILTYLHVHATHQTFSRRALIPTILIFAVAQLFVQLVFFLHLGRGAKARWNIMMLAFAAIVVLIVVIGSLWIMDNLNYRMMSSPTEINKYMNSQGNL